MDVVLTFIFAAILGILICAISAWLFVQAGVGLDFGQAFLIAVGINIAAKV